MSLALSFHHLRPLPSPSLISRPLSGSLEGSRRHPLRLVGQAEGQESAQERQKVGFSRSHGLHCTCHPPSSTRRFPPSDINPPPPSPVLFFWHDRKSVHRANGTIRAAIFKVTPFDCEDHGFQPLTVKSELLPFLRHQGRSTGERRGKSERRGSSSLYFLFPLLFSSRLHSLLFPISLLFPLWYYSNIIFILLFVRSFPIRSVGDIRDGRGGVRIHGSRVCLVATTGAVR